MTVLGILRERKLKEKVDRKSEKIDITKGIVIKNHSLTISIKKTK